MLLLVQGSIFLKGSIPSLPSVTALGELLLHAIHHVVYVAGTQLMVVNDPESQYTIMVLLSWIEACPCIQSLEDCNHIFPNQRSIGNERVGEWSDFSGSVPSTVGPLIIDTFSAVRGIICGN